MARDGDTALLIIDVQRQICAPEERGTDETVAISKRIQSLAPAFRKAGIPVYAVYSNAAHASDFYNFVPTEKDTIVIKSYDSAFKATKLQELLEQDGKKKLLVCGFNRSACVVSTVVAARKAGFDVCVLDDLTGNDSWNTEGDFGEQTLKYSGATFSTAREALGRISR